MAYLGKYIRQILSRKEAVIFPGFGSLIVSENKGVTGGDGELDPPGMIVKFDATHPKDDGKLANEYAEGEGISSDEATQQVLELVDAIKFKLDKGEKHKLDLVGEFMRDDDNKVHFVKDVNWVMDPELFGLASLDLLELDVEEKVVEEQVSMGEGEKSTESIKEDKVKMAKSEGIKTTGTKATAKKVAAKKKPVKRAPVNKWKIIWIVVGALIIVLVAILLIPSGNNVVDFGKDGIVFRDSVADDDAGNAENLSVDGVQAEGDEGMADGGDVGTEAGAEDAGDPVEEVIPEVENHYYVIAGSFQSLQNATELQDELIAKGYKSELIITENRMYRVAVQGYPTKADANAALPGIKQEKGLSGVWVLAR